MVASKNEAKPPTPKVEKENFAIKNLQFGTFLFKKALTKCLLFREIAEVHFIGLFRMRFN